MAPTKEELEVELESLREDLAEVLKRIGNIGNGAMKIVADYAPEEEEDLSGFDAVVDGDHWLCNWDDCDVNDEPFDNVGIVLHLRDVHGIKPEDMRLQDWDDDEDEGAWEEHLAAEEAKRARKKKPKKATPKKKKKTKAKKKSEKRKG